MKMKIRHKEAYGIGSTRDLQKWKKNVTLNIRRWAKRS